MTITSRMIRAGSNPDANGATTPDAEYNGERDHAGVLDQTKARVASPLPGKVGVQLLATSGNKQSR